MYKKKKVHLVNDIYNGAADDDFDGGSGGSQASIVINIIYYLLLLHSKWNCQSITHK